MASNQQPLDYSSNVFPTEPRREYVELDLKFYCTVLYIATMLYLTALPRGRLVASSMYHIILNKTENIAVNEIGRIICSHLLARAQTYFHIKLLFMHGAVTCNIVANFSTVQY